MTISFLTIKIQALEENIMKYLSPGRKSSSNLMFYILVIIFLKNMSWFWSSGWDRISKSSKKPGKWMMTK